MTRCSRCVSNDLYYSISNVDSAFRSTARQRVGASIPAGPGGAGVRAGALAHCAAPERGGGGPDAQAPVGPKRLTPRAKGAKSAEPSPRQTGAGGSSRRLRGWGTSGRGTAGVRTTGH